MAAVLIVDDEPNLLSTLAIILEHHGYEVATCSEVTSALPLIAARRFDALLADLGMPQNGFTVVEAMRRRCPQSLIILITGRVGALEELPPERRKLVDEAMYKPTDIPHLLQTLARGLAGRSS